jgi:hypothetical protein
MNISSTDTRRTLTPCDLDVLGLRGDVGVATAGGVVQAGVLVPNGGYVGANVVGLVARNGEVVGKAAARKICGDLRWEPGSSSDRSDAKKRKKSDPTSILVRNGALTRGIQTELRGQTLCNPSVELEIRPHRLKSQNLECRKHAQ